MLTFELHLPSFLAGAGLATAVLCYLLHWTLRRVARRNFDDGRAWANSCWMRRANTREPMTFRGRSFTIYEPAAPATTELHLVPASSVEEMTLTGYDR